MELKYLKSATVTITDENKTLLVDPWLSDGEYYGSWYHYPKFNLKKFLSEKIDFIYLSHIHPDHMSKKTLKLLNKNITIIIHKYAFPFFKINLEKLGFKNIVEINHGERFYIGKTFFIEVYAADDCNPKLCGKFFKCHFVADKLGSQQIDTISVISNNNRTILNVNDCPFELSKNVIKKIYTKFKDIDLLLTGYSGAGPFPQCFSNYSTNKKKKLMKIKKEKFLNQAVSYSKIVKPKYLMPFAGTYFLSSNLYKYNKYRGVPTRFEAYNYFKKLFKKENFLCKPLILKTNGTFNLKNYNQKSSLTFEDVVYNKKMYKYLSSKKLDYQKNSKPQYSELIELLEKSSINLFKKIDGLKIFSKKKIAIEIKKSKYFLIDLEKKNSYVVNENKIPKNNFVKLSLDPRLLYLIIKGPRFAHWDNADIGSHIQYQRMPDNYDSQVNYALNFFHS